MFKAKLDVCEVTGFANYTIEFNIGYGDKTDQGTFFQQEDAVKYISSSKLSYILIIFQHYVNHAKILMETGHKEFYRTPSKMEAMDRCIKANQYFQNIQLKEICRLILKIQPDLQKILPSPGNSSFASSNEKLLDIIVFAKQQLQKDEVTSIRKDIVQSAIS